MLIEDGGGTGKSAKVNSENKLTVDAVMQTIERHTNQVEGLAFNALFEVNPDGAADCIFYLKNTSEIPLIIKGVWWQTSAAEEVYYKIGDTGTAVKTNGADITPANLNSGSGQTADVICYSNTSDGAVDITGISGGTIIQKLWLTNTSSAYIVVARNQTFTIYCVGGDTLLRGTVIFNFHDIE